MSNKKKVENAPSSPQQSRTFTMELYPEWSFFNDIISHIVKEKYALILHDKDVFDDTGELEITVFPKQYKEYSSLLEKNSIILIKLARRISRSEISYIAEEIKRLEDE